MSGASPSQDSIEKKVRDLAHAAWGRFQEARRQGDLPRARAWLERARRLVPEDGLLMAALAGLELELGDVESAAARFETLVARFRAPGPWTGLAASCLLLGRLERAREAVEAALRSSVVTPGLRDLAKAVTARLGLPGWCGLDSDGTVQTGTARPVVVRLDGKRLRGRRLPHDWRARRALVAEGVEGPFLGSPLPVGAIGATEGFVEARAGGLRGWAWHPADSDRDPVLQVRGTLASLTLVASEAAEDLGGEAPFVRPRRFELSAAQVWALGEAVSVTGEDGRALYGSPLDPGLEARAASGDDGRFAPVWAEVRGTAPRIGDPSRAVDVVIPVYRGTEATMACIDSVLGSIPSGTKVHVIEDASPEPELVAALERLQATGRIRLTRQRENRGFPATANAGLLAAAGRDAVLLNSDTLVAPGWLERLRRAAYSAPDIGTATPLSNEASIVSYPDKAGGNAVPDLAGTERLDGLARRANAEVVAEIPVGVGFCLYLRRDCLDQVGLLREDVFAQGYGEENDFCLRARHLGWRHVAAADVFVAHVGGRSFGAARSHLMRRNGEILGRLHPGYDALIATHIAADPLGPARRRMDALRWAEGRSAHGAVLMVTHWGGGGVDQVVASRCNLARAQGLRPVVLRPGGDGCRLESPDEAFPNLTYAIPGELPELAELLREDRPRHLEVHHLLGHDHAVLGLARSLGVPVDAYVHDYALFCPRITLVGGEGRYCGEPERRDCVHCVADAGSNLEEPIGVFDLVARSAADLAVCRRVVAPSGDAAARLRRHFPAVRPHVQPWEDDGQWPALSPAAVQGKKRIAVIGAIGIEKGYHVLLGCVRDAARRGLPLEFAVCGFTVDDERLLAAGPVFVTGRYEEAEATALIRAQRAQVALLPSVFPETWCFALSRAWQAGLPAVAFDLGAQAERIRATGRGWVLPPGLAPPALNEMLLRLPPLPPHSLKTVDRGSPCQTPTSLLPL